MAKQTKQVEKKQSALKSEIEKIQTTAKKTGKTIKKHGITSWLQHIAMILVNPKRYFSSIVADGSFEAPMIKAFIYGLIGGALVLLLQLLGGHAITMATVFAKFIVTPILAVVVLFLLSGLIMLISEITGGERDFEIAVKGLGSVFFMYPAILCLNTLAFNCTSLWIISALVDGYVLFLIYNIVVYCMKGKILNTQIVIGSMSLFMIAIYMTDHRMTWFLIKNAGAALACLIH